MWHACRYAGINPESYIIFGLASFKFDDDKCGVFPFVYNHRIGLSFEAILVGDGTVGATNALGTVANCSSVTVLILGYYGK